MNVIEEISRRAEELLLCKQDKKRQAYVMELCRRDIIFFFNNFVYTEKNATLFGANDPHAIPFVLFPFQEELVKEIWSSIVTGTLSTEDREDFTNVFLEKSRQMGVTWVVMGILLYGYIFHNHKYLIVSRTANEVDKKGDMKSCFEKLRFMINHLPSWMLPKGLTKETGAEHNKYMSISRSDSSGSINGESASPDAGRGGTYNAVFLDEMAFMQDAAAINKACASATPCRIINSTPNGEGNEYARMKKLAEEGEIKWLRYHWSEHPLYTQEWYEWKTKGMSREQIAQELEIEYNVSIVGRVYPMFESKVRISEVDYNSDLPLFISVDNSHGGTDPHAVIVYQPEKHGDTINIIDCLQLNCSVTEIASLLGKQPVQGFAMNDYTLDFYNRYVGYKQATFISDPYDLHSALNDTSVFNEYRKFGINMISPVLGKSTAGSKVVNQITITTNNLHRLNINERCSDLISALQNARYPEIKEGSSRTTAANKPIHDWTSHYRTSLEYFMSYYVGLEESRPQKQKRRIERKNKVTGEIYYTYQ